LPESATLLTAEAFFSKAQAASHFSIIVGGEQIGESLIARLLILLEECDLKCQF
jgi:hypothetical protein